MRKLCFQRITSEPYPPNKSGFATFVLKQGTLREKAAVAAAAPTIIQASACAHMYTSTRPIDYVDAKLAYTRMCSCVIM